MTSRQIVGTTFVAADGTRRIVPAVDLPKIRPRCERYLGHAVLLEISQTDAAGNENRVQKHYGHC